MRAIVDKFTNFWRFVYANSLYTFIVLVFVELSCAVVGQLFLLVRIFSVLLPFRLMIWTAALRYSVDKKIFSWWAFLGAASIPYMAYLLPFELSFVPIKLDDFAKIPFWISLFVTPLFIAYLALQSRLVLLVTSAEVVVFCIMLSLFVVYGLFYDWLVTYWVSIIMQYMSPLQEIVGQAISVDKIAVIVSDKAGYLLSGFLLSNFLMPLGAAIAFVSMSGLHENSSACSQKHWNRWLTEQLSWVAFWATVVLLLLGYLAQTCVSLGWVNLSMKVYYNIQGGMMVVQWLPALYGLSCVHARIVYGKLISQSWQSFTVRVTTLLFYIYGVSGALIMIAILGLLDRVRNFRGVKCDRSV